MEYIRGKEVEKWLPKKTESTGKVSYMYLPYSRKYWWELNLAVEPPNRYCKNIIGFKFGGLVQDHHTYNYMREGNFGRF